MSLFGRPVYTASASPSVAPPPTAAGGDLPSLSPSPEPDFAQQPPVPGTAPSASNGASLGLDEMVNYVLERDASKAVREGGEGEQETSNIFGPGGHVAAGAPATKDAPVSEFGNRAPTGSEAVAFLKDRYEFRQLLRGDAEERRRERDKEELEAVQGSKAYQFLISTMHHMGEADFRPPLRNDVFFRQAIEDGTIRSDAHVVEVVRGCSPPLFTFVEQAMDLVWEDAPHLRKVPIYNFIADDDARSRFAELVAKLYLLPRIYVNPKTTQLQIQGDRIVQMALAARQNLAHLSWNEDEARLVKHAHKQGIAGRDGPAVYRFS